MPAEVKAQAISGVSAGYENVIDVVYPSLAASWIGRLLGMMCDSIPIRIGGVKLSYLLFGPLAAPFAFVGYVLFKMFGERYVLTNRAVQARSVLGERLLQQAALSDVAGVDVSVQSGQKFYHAGNLHILNAKGDVLLTLAGVARPQRFRQIILEAREARVRNDASLATIQSRKPA